MNNENYQIAFNENYRVLSKDEEVVLGNILNGLWIKCPSYVYDFLNTSIINSNTTKQIISGCIDDETKDYMRNLISTLLDMNIIGFKHESTHSMNKIKHATLEITTDCNLRCSHCCAECGEITKEEIDIESLKKLTSWFELNNVQSIALTGGEIFIRKDIWEILRYIRMNYTGSIEILTNGTLIKNSMIPELITLVDNISFSLDGYDESSVLKIRGKGVFQKVIEKIYLLKRNDFNNISLSMVITDVNNVDSFKKLCISLGVKPVLRVLTPEGRAEENYSTLAPKPRNIKVVKTNTDDLSKMQEGVSFRCICNMESKIFICANRNIYPCFLEKGSNNLLGTLENLLSNTLGKSKVTPIVDELSTCNKCNIRYFCASACPGHNYNMFQSEKHRKEMCHFSMNYYSQIVWN
jgi:radical SAM protein with 4Fe4S-binding SPASM domain